MHTQSRGSRLFRHLNMSACHENSNFALVPAPSNAVEKNCAWHEAHFVSLKEKISLLPIV